MKNKKYILLFFLLFFQIYCFKRPIIKSNVYVSLGDNGICFYFKDEYIVTEIDFDEDGKIFGTFRNSSKNRVNEIEVSNSFVGYKFRFKTRQLYHFGIETDK
jgi:hypothetical protein